LSSGFFLFLLLVIEKLSIDFIQQILVVLEETLGCQKLLHVTNEPFLIALEEMLSDFIFFHDLLDAVSLLIQDIFDAGKRLDCLILDFELPDINL